MEQFKAFDEINRIDDRHILISPFTGGVLSLELLHSAVSKFELHLGVPEDIRSQFNVARNMALYTYYHFALAPEVQMKTFAVIELALKCRFPEPPKQKLFALITKAVEEGLVKDSGFSHLSVKNLSNDYSKTLIKIIPALRNSLAHGSTALTHESVGHIQTCADFINQLFPAVEAVLGHEKSTNAQ